MCGFVSIHGSALRLSEYKQILGRMLASIAHRGPDGQGMHYIPDQALFGHCRLAIIDLEHGRQPMVSHCGRYALVFNGEIYNYRELRNELAQLGSPCRTESIPRSCCRL